MHRDVKPQNILFHGDCSKLADFGFCKQFSTRQQKTLTILGSPLYMSPELLDGQEYNYKIDVWALGVVMYEMLYGYCPYEGNSMQHLVTLFKQPVHFDT